MRRRVNSTVDTVVGLDLSLRAAAACAIPRRWNQNLNQVRTMVAGYGVEQNDEEARVIRLEVISEAIGEFCVQNKAITVSLEEYAFSQGQAHSHAIGEIGGVVKLELRRRLKLTPRPLFSNTARKTLLQWLPSSRGKPKGYLKRYVTTNVRRLGGVTLRWTDDEIDAFVIANHTLMLAGGTAMTFEGEEI